VSLTFRTALTALTVAAATIPVAILAYPAIHRISALVEAGGTRELILEAENGARALSYQITRVSDQGRAVAADSDVRRGVKTVLFLERADLRLAEYLHQCQVAAAAYLVNLDGTVVTAQPEAAISAPLPEAVATRARELVASASAAEPASLELMDGALAQRLRTFDAAPSPLRSDHVLVLLTPVPGLVGRPGGVLVVYVPAERLAAIAQAAVPAATAVDFERDGKSLLLAADPPVGGGGVAPRLSATADVAAPLAGAVLPPPTASQAAQTVSPSSYQIRVSEPASVHIAPVRRLGLQLSALVAWVVALLGLAGYFGARLLLRPLGLLTAQADAYAHGNYLAPQPRAGFREFDELAATLAGMAGRILSHIEAETARMAAELAALRAQMSPHFLFNTLNAIGTAITVDAKLAETMLARLASLYRLILEATKAVTWPLARELEVASNYLELERLRFGRRLRFQVAAAPAGAPPLPGLIVQTLVENAVKHGIAKAREGGEVRVEVEPVESRRYRLRVVNTGAPLKDPAARTAGDAAGAGIGLKNTVKRLTLLYGDAHGFTIRTTPLGETEVTFVFGES
jgi:signal transduction histidine kinase